MCVKPMHAADASPEPVLGRRNAFPCVLQSAEDNILYASRPGDEFD
jgi:hypothetical protein